jgi:hypothetical protein
MVSDVEKCSVAMKKKGNLREGNSVSVIDPPIIPSLMTMGAQPNQQRNIKVKRPGDKRI